MKDFMLVDDDCFDLFEEITEYEETCIVAPLSIMRKLLFWILGEDDDAKLGVIRVDSDFDEPDEIDSPYVMCYVPLTEVNLGPFEFSIKGFEGAVYVYDKIKTSFLADFDEDTAIPFHYKNEDQKVKSTDDGDSDTEISFSDDDGIIGFTENFTDGNGNYTSYSFYSTDKDLVEAVAEHRSGERRIIDMAHR